MRSMALGLIASLLAAATVPAADPITALDLDKRAVEILKDVHNRGAELYNKGDAAACHRMYEAALVTVKPFLAHHAALQKAIDDGLADIARADGSKVQAFKGHELIEAVRAALKDEIKKAEAAPKTPPTPMAKVEPPPMPKPKAETPPTPKPKVEPKPMPMNPVPADAGAKVGGVVTLDGKPMTKATVTFVSLRLKEPRVFTSETSDEGKYTVAKALPVGEYAVSVTGTGVPAKYQEVGTSAIRVDAKDGANSLNFDLKSK